MVARSTYYTYYYLPAYYNYVAPYYAYTAAVYSRYYRYIAAYYTATQIYYYQILGNPMAMRIANSYVHLPISYNLWIGNDPQSDYSYTSNVPGLGKAFCYVKGSGIEWYCWCWYPVKESLNAYRYREAQSYKGLIIEYYYGRSNGWQYTLHPAQYSYNSVIVTPAYYAYTPEIYEYTPAIETNPLNYRYQII